MAEPTKKTRKIERVLSSMLGGGTRERPAAIRADVCVAAPIGCGAQALRFRDEKSRREYRISGFCQECQDNMFGA
jgi:hypothetical protein